MLNTQKIKATIQESFYIFKENIRMMFSFDNVVNRRQFILFLIFINAIFHIFDIIWYTPYLSYIAGILSFYCILALIQKRCRDFSNSGTLWILAVSLGFIANKACHFIDTQTAATFFRNIYVIALDFQIAMYLLLFIIPSKPEPDLKLRSPLLKYPLIYTAVCWIASIITTVIVNHFAGI